jgi:hypothetical protein
MRPTDALQASHSFATIRRIIDIPPTFEAKSVTTVGVSL